MSRNIAACFHIASVKCENCMSEAEKSVAAKTVYATTSSSTPLPEHICHGGTWNNGTKQFECEHTDTLPEQGGFNEKLDEILTAFANGEYSHHWTDNRLVYTKDEAKAAIRTLVLEEIIGEDRAEHLYRCGIGCPHDESIDLYRCTCGLIGSPRAEQRKKLGGTHGTK